MLQDFLLRLSDTPEQKLFEMTHLKRSATMLSVTVGQAATASGSTKGKRLRMD